MTFNSNIFSFLKYGRPLILRAVIFYLILFTCQRLIIDYDKLSFGIKIRIIENLMPTDFGPLVQLVDLLNHESFREEGLGQLRKARVKDTEYYSYLQFYKTIVDFFPERADAHSLLGYLYYIYGDTRGAMKSYEKAIQNNPEVFWFHYNLGLLHYGLKDYKKASELLGRSLEKTADDTMQYIVSSKIVYLSIVMSRPLFGQQIRLRLQKGYQDAYRMLILSYLNNRDYQSMLNAVTQAIQNEIAPQADYFYYGSLAHFHLKNYDQAVIFAQQCLKRDKRMSQAYAIWVESLTKLNPQANTKKILNNAKKYREELNGLYLRQNNIFLQIF